MKFYGLLKEITYKKIALVMTALFLISLLPIFYCSFFDYASGDDLWEGAVAHRVLMNQGTIKEFIREVYKWAKIDYLSWEGNWSSVILWCLEPSIWGEKFYCITPWISMLSLGGGITYFTAYFLKKQLACNHSFLVIVSVILCFFSIQYMPYIRGGIFWYTGMVNYVVPYGLCLASFVWIDKFLENGMKRYYVFTTLFYSYLGGGGYIPIVFAFEILFLIIVVNMLGDEYKRIKRARWLLLPFFLLVVGVVFSLISPGNAARGGDSYYFSIIKVFTTILKSVEQGFEGMINWFFSVKPLILVIPLLSVATWEQIDITKVKWKLKHPIFVTFFLFMISCSVYAPGIYAESDVSGGVPDSIYFIFLLTYVFSIIYLTCYIKRKVSERGRRIPEHNFIEKIRITIVAGELLFCIVAGRYLIGNMAAYICFDFIQSGQLRDFEFQMQERLRILNDPEIDHAIVPEMNNEQGPFMHMALLADPNSYTNQATARFYGKKSVIAIPRAEYYELYGYQEKN